MYKTVCRLLCISFILWASPAVRLSAQQQLPQSLEDNTYGAGFFEQLRTIFGKFRESDLKRVFEEAKAIQCSELVGSTGGWRSVAFFNEDRKLGDWCKESLGEVKSDLAVYRFSGVCSDDKSEIRVSSEFPTIDSLEAYNKRQIPFDQIDVTVNDPVAVAMNPRTMAYTFDLPYLFRKRGSDREYTFMAPDRNAYYADGVAARWECKLAAAKDVTYRFLICRVITVPHGAIPRGTRWQATFGSSGFFILSDGKKAQASVSIQFDAESSSGGSPQERQPAQTKPPQSEPAQQSPSRPILKRPQR